MLLSVRGVDLGEVDLGEVDLCEVDIVTGRAEASNKSTRERGEDMTEGSGSGHKRLNERARTARGRSGNVSYHTIVSSLEVGGKTCAEARFKSGLAAKALTK